MRLVVVGEARIYREALAESLSRRPGFEVVGEFGILPTAVDAIAELAPELVLIDGRGRAAPEFARRVADTMPGVKLIATGVPEDAETLLPLAHAGVQGFVLEGDGAPGLEAVIDAVGRVGFSCPRRMVRQLLKRLAAGERAPSRADDLTAREREVVVLLDQGLSNKEIARRLGIETSTVKNHVHNILEKLKLRRRGEAAAFARRELQGNGSLIGFRKGG
ncbi:MAG: response regulator transcription factor [Gemmatimonadales bacterium]